MGARAMTAGAVARGAMAATVAALCLAPRPALARVSARFFLDGALGVAVPVAAAEYRDEFLASPELGLRLGAEIGVARRLSVAPELALDGGPLIGRRSDGVTTGRLRIQTGLRLLFGFGHGHAFFLRWLIGAELFGYGPGGRGGSGTVNAGLSTEPGIGMQFHVARHMVVGFTIAFPVGLHTFDRPLIESDVDFSLNGFVGLRI